MRFMRLFTMSKWERQMEITGAHLFKYYKKHKTEELGLNKEKRENEIIVSLTSYPKRFPTLYIVLRAIFNQSMKADRVILYLDEDVKDSDIPKELMDMKAYGLEIEKRSVNMKPHKKYYYAIKENPDAIVITIDDDMIYEKTLIENLMKSYQKNPKCVHAKRVHRILKKDGCLLPYNDWEFEYTASDKPRMDLIATGIGGVLYPPHLFKEELFNLDNIEKLCLKADDIWLKFMEIYSEIPVCYAKGEYIHPCCILETQETALFDDNVEKNMNDEYILNMEEAYNIHLSDYC